MSEPFLPPSQAEQGSPVSESKTWDDVWDLCLAHGAAPAIFAPPGEGGLKFSRLFAAMMDLEEAVAPLPEGPDRLYKFLKILLESLDPALDPNSNSR